MALESKGGLSESVVINADVDAIKKVVLDFESYPDWMSGVVGTEILKRDRKKRATEVRFDVDAVVLKINYVLKYTYKDEENIIDIGYVEGALQDVEAAYTFEPLDEDRTEVTYYYKVSYSLPKSLKGPLARSLLKQVDKKVMKSALKDLKKRVESL